MSFIRDVEKGPGFEAGYFLESERKLVRQTCEIKADGAKTIGNEKYVLAGTLWSGTYAGTETKGIVYEPVNVTSGNMPGSVVLAGRVYKDRLPSATTEALADNASFEMFESAPKVTRPDDAV